PHLYPFLRRERRRDFFDPHLDLFLRDERRRDFFDPHLDRFLRLERFLRDLREPQELLFLRPRLERRLLNKHTNISIGHVTTSKRMKTEKCITENFEGDSAWTCASLDSFGSVS